MIKVKVRFESSDANKLIKLEGYTKDQPQLGKIFEMFLYTGNTRMIIELGKVYNIKAFGDMLLVQTEQVVAEVWVEKRGSEEQKGATILPFKRPESERKGASSGKTKLKTMAQIMSYEEVTTKLKLVDRSI